MQRRTLFIIIGVIVALLIIGGLGAFLLIPSLTSANTATSTPTPSAATPATTPSAKTNPLTQALKTNSAAIKSQIAQGLKLTPDQLTTELRSGKTLSDIATAQGVSSTQLQTLVSSAIQSGLQSSVANGDITQTQVDKYIKRLQNNPTLLDHLLGAGAKAGGNKKGTPTATPAQ